MYEDMFKEEMSKDTVFKDQSKLSPDFVPDELVHRDEEFRELVQFFKPVLEDGASQRVLITGSVGVGKTALASRFGEELESAAKKENIDLVYRHINCRKKGTPQMVIHKLASEFPLSIPRRGFAPQEIMEHVVDYLEKKDVHLAITLDELDHFIKNNGPDLLYSLTRVAEESGGPNRLSIIATSYSSGFLEETDEATRSTFMHNLIEMDEYDSDQLFDILNQRVRMAFKPDMVREEALRLISDISARRGDARFALELLWFGGKIASEGKVKEVSPNHIRKAKSEIHPGIKKDVLADLDKHELIFLLALSRKLKNSKNAYALTGEVKNAYEVVCEEYKEEPRKHVQFWNYINNTKNLGIIDTEPSGEGHRGKSQKISISDAPPKMMEEEIKKILNKT